ncbi:MAG: MATE family efflux transporter [Bacillus subtilis]|nr:MATE family efflux transporter [Bacillus subtilis]
MSANEEARRKGILEGNLWKTVLFVTAPLALYALFNFFYIFFDLVIVSTIGSTEVASVVFIDEIKSAILAFGAGIAAGGSVIVARLYGAGRWEEARKNAAQAFLAAFLIASFFAIMLIGFGVPLMRLLNAPSEVIASGMGYYRIQILSTSIMAINSVYFGLEKAKGNSKTILAFHLFAMVLKLLLSMLFVFGLGFGMTYIALATLISQGVLMIVAIRVLVHPANSLRIEWKRLRLDWATLSPILALSAPVVVGKFLFSMGKVIVNSMAAFYGSTAVAAFGVALKINQGANAIPHIIEESETTIISQNLGQGQLKRAIKTYQISETYAFVTGLIGMGITLLALDWMIGMFATHAQPGYQQLIADIYHWEKFSNITSAAIALITGLFIGFKRTKMSFVFNLLRLFVFRIPLLWLFIQLDVGPESLGYIMFLSNLGTFAIAVILMMLFVRKVKMFGYMEMTYR